MRGCSFIGHKDCPSRIKEPLFDTIEHLIVNEKIDRFYVGTQGNFDWLVYEVLCELEKRYKIEIFVVLAYLAPKAIYEKYDMTKTIFPDELTKVPPRFAIRRRNSFMIDQVEYVITYMNDSLSNTYNNVSEAIRKKKRVINLGKYDIESI